MATEFYPVVSAEKPALTLITGGGHVAVEAAASDASTETDPEYLRLKETLSGLLAPAYAGSLVTVDQVNANRKKNERIHVSSQERIEAEFEQWFDKPRFDYTSEIMKNNPDLVWKLTATPNATVSDLQLLGCAIKFGNDQPMPTKIARDSIIDQYSPEEISGTNPSDGKDFKFKLIALSMSQINVDLQMLQSMRQGKHSFMEGASPLESMNWLNTLRASGEELVGSDIHEATYMTNLSLRPKYIKGSWHVPSLHINPSGALIIGSLTIFESDDSAGQSIHDSFRLSVRPMVS